MIPNIIGPQVPTIDTFDTFYEDWLTRQEHYLQELIRSIRCNHGSNQENEHGREDLIFRVLAHHGEYYEAKAKIAQENVFLALSPSWLNSIEKSYMWISGFKPGLAVRVATTSIVDLTEDQLARLNLLTAEIKREEKELTDMLTKVQEAMATLPMVTLGRERGQVKNGAVDDLEFAMDSLRTSMESLVECADYLRMKTVIKILEMVNSSQALRFLAAVTSFQLNIHRYGQRRDAESGWPSSQDSPN